jgi:hypothetical protein
VVAETRSLLSYALSNRSLLMAWANTSLPAAAAVAEQDGVPDRLTQVEEGEAWRWAMRVAERAGAHFLYRVPTPQMWIFLGLWDVRPARPGDEPFSARAPWPWVRGVLEALTEALANGRDVRPLARGYGRTMAEDEVRRGTPTHTRLVSVGERLAALADAEDQTIASGLVELDREVAGFTD